MFAIPGIIALMVFVYVRPQDLVGGVFTRVPFLYLNCGLALFGLAVDLKLRIIKPIPAPALLWGLLFVIWAAISTAIKAGPLFTVQMIELGTAFLMFVVIAQGVQSFKSLQTIVFAVISCSLFLIVIAAHQGQAPYNCAIDHGGGMLTAEDRPCVPEETMCTVGGEPGAIYRCERVGLFDTTSIKGRVRYIGVLQDPNELAVAIGASFALLIAWTTRKRTVGAWVFLIVAGTLASIALVMTQSRGGQLVFAMVLGVYFVSRFGLGAGIVIGLMLAAPMLLLGGRSDAASDHSTLERYEAWRAGSYMFRTAPIMGVGKGMYDHIHYLTAHNSYVLVWTELGLVGWFLWSTMVYITVKTCWVARKTFETVAGAAAPRNWSLGLIAAYAGTGVGIMFLSMSYHFVIWIYLGLGGALYSSIKSHVPDFRVRYGLKDVAFIVVFDILFMFFIEGILRLKGF